MGKQYHLCEFIQKYPVVKILKYANDSVWLLETEERALGIVTCIQWNIYYCPWCGEKLGE